VAIAFGVYLELPASPGFPLERWIPLRPGEYLQGAVAKVYAEQRGLRGHGAAPGRVRERAALLAEGR